MDKQKLTRKQIKAITEELKNVEITKEETQECYHLTLEKVYDAGMYYQCSNCKTVFHIFGAAAYKPESLVEELKSIVEKLDE